MVGQTYHSPQKSSLINQTLFITEVWNPSPNLSPRERNFRFVFGGSIFILRHPADGVEGWHKEDALTVLPGGGVDAAQLCKAFGGQAAG